MKIIFFSSILVLLASCSSTSQTSTSEQQPNSGEVSIREDLSDSEQQLENTGELDSTMLSELSGQEVIIQEDDEEVYGELSLQTLMDEQIVGSDLKLEQVLATTSKYTRYRISYKNGDISLSGIMNIPIGDGPFPLLVLNHGYIDTRYYTNGRGLKREQNYFSNNGFAVLHPDYRNHAFSDKVPEEPYDFRLGYSRDVIASVFAVRSSEIPELDSVDTSKIGMLGHSMGGGITQNIAVSKPELVDAVVLYGPVSNQEYKNFEQFQLPNSSRSSRVEQVIGDHKTPQENPTFWVGVSSQTFFQNISAPFMIFTGIADDSTPTQWAEDIAADLRENNKQVQLISYPGEGHEFGPQFNDFMQKSGEFFKNELK